MVLGRVRAKQDRAADTDAQVRPYTFNPQPFLADPNSAMQGYVTSEPYAIEKITGVKPKLFLLADYGFNSYSTLIQTRREVVERKPDVVQRFVDASIIGWYNYIYGDNHAGTGRQLVHLGDAQCGQVPLQGLHRLGPGRQRRQCSREHEAQRRRGRPGREPSSRHASLPNVRAVNDGGDHTDVPTDRGARCAGAVRIAVHHYDRRPGSGGPTNAWEVGNDAQRP